MSLVHMHATSLRITEQSSPTLHAARIEASFVPRTWSVPGVGGRNLCQLFLIMHGKASFAPQSGKKIEITAPFFIWLPGAQQGHFRLDAGSFGHHAAINASYVWRTTANTPMATDLRALLDQPMVLFADRLTAELAGLHTSFCALEQETQQPAVGTSAIVGFHLGLVLVLAWRASGITNLQATRHPALTTLQRYLQLIELHYRDSLGIDGLAAMLGVTRAHLHDACVKSTGRTPLSLIHHRLVDEARENLLQSQLSVAQIGYSLGFRDPGYFNRFFKRQTGTSPGDFRKAGQPNVQARTGASFAAWP